MGDSSPTIERVRAAIAAEKIRLGGAAGDRIRAKLRSMRFDPTEGATDAERAYRRGWNDAMDNIEREVLLDP